VRDTTPADAVHPAIVVVVQIGDYFSRIVVPPTVWPASRELLGIGQRVGVTGITDSYPIVQGSRQVATEIRLAGSGMYH
jgi:hypothetical protein